MPTDADVGALCHELAQLRALVSRTAAVNAAATGLLLDTLCRRKALCAADIDAAVRSIRSTLPDYLRGPDLDRFLASVQQRYGTKQNLPPPSCAWKPTLITGGRQLEPADAPK